MSFSQSLRNTLIRTGMLAFLFLLLLYPSSALTGAKNGLLLWFNQLLPGLLPFLILSSLFLSTNLSDRIAHQLSPILSPMFRCSPSGCYAIIIGLISGLPVGAKTVASLIDNKKITKKEGQYLLALCNNMSPMFLMSYVCVSVLKAPKLRYPLLFLVIFSSAVAAFLTRPKKDSCQTPMSCHQPVSDKFTFSFVLLDSAIEQAFHVLFKVGGYMILFSVLAQFLSLLPFPDFVLACIGSILEITTGSYALSQLSLPKTVLFPLVVAFSTFGGLSCGAQTKSVLTGTGLPFAHYLLTKLLAAVISGLLLFLFLCVV